MRGDDFFGHGLLDFSFSTPSLREPISCVCRPLCPDCVSVYPAHHFARDLLLRSCKYCFVPARFYFRPAGDEPTTGLDSFQVSYNLFAASWTSGAGFSLHTVCSLLGGGDRAVCCCQWGLLALALL